MTIITPVDITPIEEELKEKAAVPAKKIKKVSKLDYIVNLYTGKPGREGDVPPANPIQEIEDLAEKVQAAEENGYFRVRIGTKTERNSSKYISETKWYLTQAAKKGLIDRKYNPRKKVEA